MHCFYSNKLMVVVRFPKIWTTYRGGAGKGKVARHTEAQNIADNQMRRCSSDRRKVKVITRGGLSGYGLIEERSQQKS